MKRVMRNLYRDTYSNTFDSVTAFDTGLASCQATLMKMILSLHAPVLSMPQIFDSMPLLMLTQDCDFLKILDRGIISTSLFGQNASLKEYVESCLRREDYIFSCFPFLSQGSASDKLSRDTKDNLLKRIQSNKEVEKPYSEDVRKYEYFLNIFVDGVLKLNSHLEKKPSDEMDNYRRNRQSDKTVPLSQRIKTNVDVLRNCEQFIGEPIVKNFDSVVSRVIALRENVNDRTRYYNVLADYKGIEDTEKQEIRELINISYNQHGFSC
jgi:hypothetical protein